MIYDDEHVRNFHLLLHRYQEESTFENASLKQSKLMLSTLYIHSLMIHLNLALFRYSSSLFVIWGLVCN